MSKDESIEQDKEPTGNPEIYDYDPDYIRPQENK